MKKCFKYFIFYSAIFFAVFILLSFILPVFNLMLRQWFDIAFVSIISVTFILGIFQLLFLLKNKIIKIILFILFALVTVFIFCPILLVVGAFGINKECVIEKDGQKYLIYIHNFHKTSVNYYEYKGWFVSGKRLLFTEYYGKTGFDPYNTEINKPNLKEIKYYNYSIKLFILYF